MFVHLAQRMLYTVSAWLRRWTDWTTGMAAKLGVRPANEQDVKVTPDTLTPEPGRPPADWLVRTQPRPPAHWLEHIRRASTGQQVEIHAQAQPRSQSAVSDQPPNGVVHPVIIHGGEPMRTTPGRPSIQEQPTRQSPSAPVVETLPFPPGVPRPVLYLAETSSPPALGNVHEDETEMQKVSGIASPQAGGANQSPSPQPIYPSLTQHTPDLPELATSPITPGEAASSVPTGVFPAKQRPDLAASSVPQPHTAAQSGLAPKPERELTSLPQPSASPKWPDLLPFQSSFILPANRAAESVSTQLQPTSGTFNAAGIPSASNRVSFDTLSSHWPELTFMWIENNDWDLTPGDSLQQLERHQRLDQEQRGSFWNT
jgi:hypothetical protein